MNTRKRPGIVTWEVRRAPLVPSGSLTTWTRISCSFQQVLDLGLGFLTLAIVARRGPLPGAALAARPAILLKRWRRLPGSGRRPRDRDGFDGDGNRLFVVLVLTRLEAVELSTVLTTSDT